ncbi:hypothetical protein RBH29_11855 [Herbivorax sp. ANBcel31]|uniref:tetratricopeptide repeat protein n=1 Tax=Herbivorax sp. ANBcel31 TaxID=3069754 RepID=UPI0027B0E4B7|nr:hypothetical protein [Herbivorax sp. ANBcel31]MDQ2087120.1 hypothetical protein [Herbivorax sp. ANBcel31]
MKNKVEKIDIRVIKYEEYVKKNPQKAYGFYCLGRLHFMMEKYKVAENYFKQALSIDDSYTRAKIGLIESYIFRKKFMKAVHLFSKYRQDINKNYIFRVKLVRGVSSFYSEKKFFRTDSMGFIKKLFLKHTMNYAKELVKKESNNIVLKIILSMYYLQKGENNIFVTQMFKTCVYWDGLDNQLRWELLKTLSDSGDNLVYDMNIARKFTSIPHSNCSDEYVGMILGSSMIKGDVERTSKIYNLANKYNKKLSPQVLWRYVYWCKENSFYDYSVYDCCEKLIKLGWVDKVVAQTLLMFKEKNTVKFTKRDEHILKLFGYS